LLVPGTILLLQREVTPEESWELARRAAKRSATVVLNLAPAGSVPADVLRCVDWLVLNETEAAELARMHDLGEGDDAALANAFEIGVVITLGSHGIAASKDQRRHRVPALKITPVDTVGAGDAAVGAFAAALDRKPDIQEALRWASVAGGLACLTPGAQTSLPTETQIRNELRQLV
jgi:ribokinase